MYNALDQFLFCAKKFSNCKARMTASFVTTKKSSSATRLRCKSGPLASSGANDDSDDWKHLSLAPSKHAQYSAHVDAAQNLTLSAIDKRIDDYVRRTDALHSDIDALRRAERVRLDLVATARKLLTGTDVALDTSDKAAAALTLQVSLLASEQKIDDVDKLVAFCTMQIRLLAERIQQMRALRTAMLDMLPEASTSPRASVAQLKDSPRRASAPPVAFKKSKSAARLLRSPFRRK